MIGHRVLFTLVGGLLLCASIVGADSFSFSGDSLQADLAEGRERTILSGNARLVSDDLTITADRVELYGEDFNYALCTGGVTIEDQKNDTTFFCDRVQFNRRDKVIRLQGGAVMEDRKNEMVIKGEILENRDQDGLTLIQVAVRILKEDLVSRSQTARYYREENRLELSGSPVVRWKGDTYRASRIRIDLDSDTIQLEGDVQAEVQYEDEGEEDASEPEGETNEGTQTGVEESPSE